jgi:hypothetical protein
MLSLVEMLLSEDVNAAKLEFRRRVAELLRVKVEQFKARIALNEYGGYSIPGIRKRNINNVRRVGRLKYIKLRVRRGKIQRRKRVSAVKGWTFRQNHLVRMKPAERLHRRLAARRAKIKRRSKMVRIRRRTAFSMRKRRAIGLSSKPFGRY